PGGCSRTAWSWWSWSRHQLSGAVPGASATAADSPIYPFFPPWRTGLSAGASVTQAADRRAHLVTTPRRCAFGLFVAYAYATALPAKTRLLTLRTSDNGRLLAHLGASRGALLV